MEAAMSSDSTGNESSEFIRPYWMPDIPYEDLPKGVQTAMQGVILPGYKDLVAGAPDTMERLVGISVVHLAQLEVLDQIELPTASAEGRSAMVVGHVRLSGAKLRALGLLRRLREAREQSAAVGPSE
jgi:hypothetical protein